jgi:neutral ceramidase
MRPHRALLATVFLSIGLAQAAHAQTAGPDLKAGAAKVDITPAASELAQPTDVIHDHMFARAIVVASGGTCAVLVGLDYGAARDEIVNDARTRAARATGCPEANIIISATHTHSSNTQGLGAGSPSAKRVADAIVSAATQAKSALRLARVGYGTTQLDLNVNRDLYTRQGAWAQGPNPDGPSDKTLAVVGFIGDDFKPIGVYMNYAMHPINFYLTGVISADFPGVASRTVEASFGDKAVAIFTQGASGDQNPLYSERTELTRIRTGQGPLEATIGAPPPPPSKSINPVADLNLAMNNPVPAKDLDAYRQAIARTSANVDAMGTLVAQATLNTLRAPIATTANASIWGGERAFSCPGRERLDAANPARENVFPGYKDAGPVALKVGLLKIGDIDFVTVNGEVYSQIGMRLKAASPASRTIMVTLTNGAAKSGYIYADEAYHHLSFQVISSRLKPGCAEDGIVNAALDLIAQASNRP